MENNLRKVLDVSLDFITLIDREYRYQFANQAYCRQFGRERESVEGKTVEELWGRARFREKILPHLERCFAGQEDYEVDRFQFGEGFRYVQVTYTPYTDATGRVTHVLVYSRDLTTMKELESKIQNIEYKDPATGLLNRRSFDIVLEMELEKARVAKVEHCAVLFLSLKNFNRISVEYGAKTGDLLLEAAGARIQKVLRERDFVFRMEAFHFAVLLTAVQSSQVEAFGEALASAIADLYPFQGTAVPLGAEIGFSMFPDNGTNPEDLTRYALSALQESHRLSKPVAFDPDLHQQTLRKERLRDDIRTAVAEAQFVPFFQPIVDAQGRLAGAESLIRWPHPALGPISPAEFIPLAEESGDAPLVDSWMLSQVLKALETWRDHLAGRYISVNLSAANFAGGSIITEIKESLGGRTIAPGSLKVEVTETQPMENVELAVDKINALTRLGVEVLIDDFGAGYSSLAYLKKLPAQTIKIDKTFVDNIAESADDREFLAGMIRMINTQNRKIVAEGVETKEQWELLKDMGVELFQGYLFSKPLPAADFEALLLRSPRSEKLFSPPGARMEI